MQSNQAERRGDAVIVESDRPSPPIRLKDLPEGAAPQNKVRFYHKQTGEIRDVYAVDAKAYDSQKNSEWSRTPPARIGPAPKPAAPRESEAGEASWDGWTDAELTAVAAEVGVPKPEKKTREALIAAVSKKGVEPGDEKPQVPSASQEDEEEQREEQ